MSHLIGEWRCVECKNIESVMIEVVLEQFDHPNRILTIDIEGNEVYMRDEFGSRRLGTTFVLGKEIQELTPDGRIVQSVVELDSDKQLTQIQKHGFNQTRITREVFGDTLIMRMKAGDSVAVLKFIRIGEPKDTKQYFTPPEPEVEPEDLIELEPIAQAVVN
ncbi:unnamed protein product [Echinostoma caproni]|uniref:Fatty acid-binding protein n=1 Tax=Echinostoma caproni TaxID=27848 RepID=A0A183AI53_9TREM|nr:unnamed protein product [Echinostoma caproni]